MDLTFEQLDRDGALVEAVERLSGSRANLFRSAAVGGGALLGLLVVPASATAAGARDTDILNFALCLEYLQAAFYKDAVMMKKLGGKPALAARMVGAVEQAHVAAYRNLLGSKALARPRFNFHGTTESQTKFLRTAIALEDLAVAAYKAQIPLLTGRPVIAAAVSIHSVEARHAAWMRRLLGVVPARAPFDDGEGRPAVNRTLASTGFIVQKKPRMIAQRGPRFTG